MNLFERLKRPFAGGPQDHSVQPRPAAPPVGEILRARREELGLELDAVGEALRIRPAYLAALEQGRTEDLPGPAYAIGFIRAYAQHLGLDGERALARYKAESADVHIRPDLSLPVPLGERSLPGGRILLVAAILALCGYGSWYYLATGERSRPERVPPVPADLQQAASAANPGDAKAEGGTPQLSTGLPPGGPDSVEPPLTGVAPRAAPVPPTGAAASADRQAPAVVPPTDEAAAKPAGDIEIRAATDCWIQVRSADGRSIVFSRVLKTGESYHVPRAGLLLRTGNAGALTITVNGKPAPSIGHVGTLRRSVALDPDALLAGTAVHG